MTVSVCWPLLEPEPQMYGEINSSQYPQPYPPNLEEQWHLRVPEGFRLRVTFTHLDIEASAGCLYDVLTVRATFKHHNVTCGADLLKKNLRCTFVFQVNLCRCILYCCGLRK